MDSADEFGYDSHPVFNTNVFFFVFNKSAFGALDGFVDSFIDIPLIVANYKILAGDIKFQLAKARVVLTAVGFFRSQAYGNCLDTAVKFCKFLYFLNGVLFDFRVFEMDFGNSNFH